MLVIWPSKSRFILNSISDKCRKSTIGHVSHTHTSPLGRTRRYFESDWLVWTEYLICCVGLPDLCLAIDNEWALKSWDTVAYIRIYVGYIRIFHEISAELNIIHYAQFYEWRLISVSISKQPRRMLLDDYESVPDRRLITHKNPRWYTYSVSWGSDRPGTW